MAQMNSYIWALMLISLLFLVESLLTSSSPHDTALILRDNQRQQQQLDGRQLLSSSRDPKPKKLRIYIKKSASSAGAGVAAAASHRHGKTPSATKSSAQISSVHVGSVLASSLFLGLFFL